MNEKSLKNLDTSQMLSEFYLNSVSVKSVGISSHQNPKYRSTMEDEHVFIDAYGGRSGDAFFAVYDGHGGKEVATFLSKNLHVEFLETFNQLNLKTQNSTKQELIFDESELINLDSNEDNSNVETMIKLWNEAIIQTHATIDDIIVKETKIKKLPLNTGSTSAIAILHSTETTRYLFAANLGDSRVVLSRGGVAERLTYDHKATDIREVKRVQSSGGHIFFGRVGGALAVSRAFGDCELKSEGVIAVPYISTTELKKEDDLLIVACDGLWDVMTDQEAVDLIRENKEKTTQELSELLLGTALIKETADNLSIMVIKL